MAVIAIVGAGLIGRAWAIAFARGGHEVRVYDGVAGAAEKAVQFATNVLPALAEEGLLDGQSPSHVARRLRVMDTLPAAVSGASHVQENTPENLETKQRVFAQLDDIAAPDAVLASSGDVIETIERERRTKLPEAELQRRQVWRDRRLMGLAAHKRKASRDIGS
ncbi:3-hydroxyacyl-CoA dehydrogenase NAD-binding domain-containing protein [Dongia deserti]|uniref:3-hydroxyacyl-CoA dehydrogenase NAD-binding domain-containing protein n=1 Tax=Dongia deserti TaxID=2268030 RepID=UPI000E654090|nr:3-hydroxyacyl-CoA dehydrogenase NAD-binding domain-containing protein [Dongia deserti]